LPPTLERLAGLRGVLSDGDRHRVHVEAERNGDRLHVRAAARTPLAAPAVVQLVRFQPRRSVEITHGENAGHTFVYANVVEDWEDVQMWDGREPLDLRLPLTGPHPAAILVQSLDHGAILGAAKVD
jgi:hypothetical protein